VARRVTRDLASSLVPEAGASPIDLEPVLSATQADLVRRGDDWGIGWIVGTRRGSFTRIAADALVETLGSDPGLDAIISYIERRLIASGFEVTRLDAKSGWVPSPGTPAAWDLKRPPSAASH